MSDVEFAGFDVSKGTLDIAVSCDGTWQKRGQESLFGIEAVIAADSGKVLDYEIQSKSCQNCQAHSHWDRDTAKYREWKEAHKAICNINFAGSSGSMEAVGSVVLWNRSLEVHDFRYTIFIGDGDSSSYKKVVASKPYGEDVTITKSDCIDTCKNEWGRTCTSCRSL